MFKGWMVEACANKHVPTCATQHSREDAGELQLFSDAFGVDGTIRPRNRYTPSALRIVQTQPTTEDLERGECLTPALLTLQ